MMIAYIELNLPDKGSSIDAKISNKDNVDQSSYVRAKGPAGNLIGSVLKNWRLQNDAKISNKNNVDRGLYVRTKIPAGNLIGSVLKNWRLKHWEVEIIQKLELNVQQWTQLSKEVKDKLNIYKEKIQKSPCRLARNTAIHAWEKRTSQRKKHIKFALKQYLGLNQKQWINLPIAIRRIFKYLYVKGCIKTGE